MLILFYDSTPDEIKFEFWWQRIIDVSVIDFNMNTDQVRGCYTTHRNKQWHVKS